MTCYLSLLQGYKKNSTFIATQCPLKETENDFWKMIWEQESVTIVLLSSVDEVYIYQLMYNMCMSLYEYSIYCFGQIKLMKKLHMTRLLLH